jgi:molybdopterin synthase catalytic subunit
LANFKRPDVGAIVSFVGTVRGVSQDGSEPVQALDYEVYDEMALAKFQEVERAAKASYEIQDTLIIHRTARLAVSENIVLIAVAAAHRKPAFEACEYIIDELKKIVPIWKKEITDDNEYWVEGE